MEILSSLNTEGLIIKKARITVITKNITMGMITDW
ncbi:unnamed protein product, partial [marine sediment metagenome]